MRKVEILFKKYELLGKLKNNIIQITRVRGDY